MCNSVINHLQPIYISVKVNDIPTTFKHSIINQPKNYREKYRGYELNKKTVYESHAVLKQLKKHTKTG